MTTYKVIGMFLWVSALVLLMQLCGAPFNIFVNIPAAIFVLLGIFGAVMLTKSPQQTRSERFNNSPGCLAFWFYFICSGAHCHVVVSQ